MVPKDPFAGGGPRRHRARAVGVARLCAGLPLAMLFPLLSMLSLALGVSSDSTSPVPLGRAGEFALLAKAAITSAAKASISGNVGISPNTYTALTGFALTPVGANTGTPYAAESGQVDSGLVYAADYGAPTP
jgi:hypothetical protein